MKKLGTIFAVILLIMFNFLMLFACKSEPEQIKYSPELWKEIVPLPYSGDISGTEGMELLIQIQVCIENKVEKLEGIDIIEMTLNGEESEINCSDFDVGNISLQYNEAGNFSHFIFQFRAVMPSNGAYTVDRMKIKLKNGETFEKPLGEIKFMVIDPSNLQNEPPIKLRQFMIAQGSSEIFMLSYENKSSKDVEILGIDFSNNLLKTVKITKYLDEKLIDKEEGFNIPPNETFIFLFELSKNVESFDKVNYNYLILLPIIKYKVDGKEFCSIAQHQPTIVYSQIK